MKRKVISILLCLVLLTALAGCGSGGPSTAKTGKKPAGVNDVLEQGMAEADNKNGNSSSPAEKGDTAGQKGSGEASGKKQAPEPSAKGGTEGIDVDLTVLSGTMVYSEVYNMMVNPDDYMGKVIKMKGPFAYFHDEKTGNYYFACIIQDATACCAQGLEFELTKDYVFPDDYPDVNEEVCVMGTFDTYSEGNRFYITLRNATLL